MIGAALLLAQLLAVDPAASESEVARELDRLRARGTAARDAGPALATLLPEQAALYRGRGPAEAVRLRGYVLATMADIGTPAEAIPFIVAELAHGHRAYLMAAAARAAGGAGPAARSAVPHLLRILEPGFHDDDQVCLDAYNAAPPYPKTTTVRIEAIRSLARIGARDALPVLRAMARSESALREEAQRAAWAIERPDRPTDRTPPAEFVTDWLPRDERVGTPLRGLVFTAQDGGAWPSSQLAGAPLALTFAYTRCDNPNKCPVTIASMARLRRALRDRQLETRVRLAIVTLDPRHDDIVQLANAARIQGLQLDEHALMLRPSPEELRILEERLDVPVGHGAGQINGHGIALYLFDREGRYVRRYHSVVWDSGKVVADLRRLAAE